MADKELLFFVPGIMASSLTRARLITGPAVVWKNDAHLAVYGPDAMDLAADGVSPGPLASGPLTADNLAFPDYYAPLFKQVNADQWDCKIFLWDWRKGIKSTAKSWAKYLNDNFAGRRFWVLAHSAGGLLARFIYPEFAAIADSTLWQRTVYVGVPHGGSYVAPQFASGALPELGDWSALVAACGLGFRRLTSPWKSLSPLPNRIRQVLSSWPSLWELSPNEGNQWSDLDPNATEFQKLANFAVSNPYATDNQITRGIVTRAQLDDLLAQPRPSEVCIAGRGQVTPSKLRVNPVQLWSPNGYENTTEGDTVVTVERATLANVPTITMDADHHTVLVGGATLSRISEWLVGLVPGLTVLPDQPLPGIKGPLVGMPQTTKNTIDFPFPALIRKNDP